MTVAQGEGARSASPFTIHPPDICCVSVMSWSELVIVLVESYDMKQTGVIAHKECLVYGRRQSANKHLIRCADHRGMSERSGWALAYLHEGEIITRSTPAQNSAGTPSPCTPCSKDNTLQCLPSGCLYLDYEFGINMAFVPLEKACSPRMVLRGIPLFIYLA